MKQPVKAALYMRLSRDDEEYGDSVSIETQRKIIRQYAEENHLYVVGEYIDDGWSGTNFDRPDFQRMIEDTKTGKVNCIITKDLSRFGREHIQADYYLEIDFPSRNIRYIAVSDNEDTEKGLSDFVPFKNLFNEWFARDTSRKVKSAFKAKFQAGEHICKYAPLGYMKDPQIKNHLIPNPETRWIIEKIFSLAYQGNGCARILRYLCENKVPTAAWWIFKEKGTGEYSFDGESDERRYAWSIAQVKKIMKDPTYIGHSVHYTETKISFKNKKRVKHRLEDCVITENTHEPLVSVEVFEEVNRQIKRRHRPKKDGEILIFSGLLYCSECGRTMTYGYNSKASKPWAYYSCRKYTQGLKKCSIHYIRYDVIYECILNRIKLMIGTMKNDDGEILRQVMQQQTDEISANSKKVVSDLDRAKRRLKVVDDLLSKLYEDRIAGELSERNFAVLSQKYQTEQDELEQKITELSAHVNKAQNQASGVERFMESLRQQQNPEELTSQLLRDLIDKIIVHEAVKKEDGTKEQELEIYWRFVGRVDETLYL